MSDDLIPTGPTASPKAVREAKNRARFTRRQALDQWRTLVDTPARRQRMRAIIEQCGVFAQEDLANTNRVLVHEGKRAVGLWLITELEAADPKALADILFTPKEANIQ